MILWELFLGFLEVGCFSFGGAYAAIPLIRDVVLSRGWLTEEALTDMIAVSESTPGPIMVNLATYVGSTKGGFAGAALATLAVILPAFVIILLVTAVMNAALKNQAAQAVMRGLSACVTGVILATGCWMLFRNCAGQLFEGGQDFRPLVLGTMLAAGWYAAGIKLKKRLSPILLILVSAAAGVAVFGV